MNRARYVSRLQALGALSLVLLALAGCGGSNGDGAPSGVRLLLSMTTGDEPSSQQVSSGTFDALPRQVQPDAIDFVKCVQVMVTGPGIPGSVEEALNVPEAQQTTFMGRLTKTVPSGNDRRIDVVACNGREVGIFAAETTVDLANKLGTARQSWIRPMWVRFAT